MKKRFIILAAAVIVIVLLGIGGYIFLHQPKTGSHSGEVAPTYTIKLNSASVYFLTDARGMTLYHSIKDIVASGKPTQSTCTGACSATWPPFYVDTIVVPSSLNASDFTVFTRSDGKKQLAYLGLPLYYYSGDHMAGDTNGQGIGSVWYMGIEPDYGAGNTTN